MLTIEHKLPQDWAKVLRGEFSKPYFAGLCGFVDSAYKTSVVFPQSEKMFAAFEMTPYESVRVVILGQDPYHEPGQAQGLAFYVPPNVRKPPSLVNI